MRRPSLLLAGLALLTLSSLLDAAPRRAAPAPPPPGAPGVEAGNEGGVAVLRAPGATEVLIRAGTFTMGSTDAEFAAALALCRAEPRREDCKEEWFVSEQAPHEVYL